jgi:hypothetical protein
MRDVDFSYRMFMKVVDFRFRLLAFRGAGGEPPGALRLQESHLSHLSRWSLAPCTPINLSMESIIKIHRKHNFF